MYVGTGTDIIPYRIIHNLHVRWWSILTQAQRYMLAKECMLSFIPVGLQTRCFTRFKLDFEND